VPLTLAFAVVACRLVLTGCTVFAACSPPAGSVHGIRVGSWVVSLLRGS
jgi:hypothetical protein